jgi:arabinose-5-phosphate isomerase
MNPEESCAVWGRRSVEEASAALARTAQRLGTNLERALDLILATPGKVVVTGMGKSGLVGRKITATLCSTGTPSVFLHPADAVHGDMGVYAAGDATILLSKSGTTAELVRLLPVFRRFRSPIIGIIGNTRSALAREVDVLLDASVEREGDEHSLVPTTSSIVAMALGDALAVALMRARRITPEEFGEFHPAGQIGRNLRLTVADAMHEGDEVAWVRREAALREVVIAMTRHPLGAACVVNEDGALDGLITDGDLRRALEAHEDVRALRASDIMTACPLTITPQAWLREALRLMEDRPSQISVLPVVEPATGICRGLLRLHDIYHGRPQKPDNRL